MFAFPKSTYSKQNFKDAILELLSVLLLGFLPITLGLLFAWLTSSGSVAQFSLGFLASGEALLLSTALVGPLVYVLLRNYGEFPSLSGIMQNHTKFPGTVSIQFPYGWFFITFIILICVIAAGVFGYNSALSGSNKILPENMQILSGIIFFSSLLVFFFISIVRNNLVGGAPKIMRKDTKNFLDEWDQA